MNIKDVHFKSLYININKQSSTWQSCSLHHGRDENFFPFCEFSSLSLEKDTADSFQISPVTAVEAGEKQERAGLFSASYITIHPQNLTEDKSYSQMGIFLLISVSIFSVFIA